jgi:hypothetical protein
MLEIPALTRKPYPVSHVSLCPTVEVLVLSARVPVKLGMDNRAISTLRHVVALLKTATDGTIWYLFYLYPKAE